METSEGIAMLTHASFLRKQASSTASPSAPGQAHSPPYGSPLLRESIGLSPYYIYGMALPADLFSGHQ